MRIAEAYILRAFGDSGIPPVGRFFHLKYEGIRCNDRGDAP